MTQECKSKKRQQLCDAESKVKRQLKESTKQQTKSELSTFAESVKKHNLEDLRVKDAEILYPPVLPKTDSKGTISMMSIEDAKKLRKLYMEEKERKKLVAGDCVSTSSCSDDEKPTKPMPSTCEEYIDEEGLIACNKKLLSPTKVKPWVDTLDHVLDETVCEKEKIDVHEDLKREERFAELTQKGVTTCLERLKRLKIPFSRPKDYFADMLKSDYQMQKVKAVLLDEQEKIKLAERRKESKFQKKFAKQVKAKKLRDEQVKKAKHLEKIESLKKKAKSQQPKEKCRNLMKKFNKTNN